MQIERELLLPEDLALHWHFAQPFDASQKVPVPSEFKCRGGNGNGHYGEYELEIEKGNAVRPLARTRAHLKHLREITGRLVSAGRKLKFT